VLLSALARSPVWSWKTKVADTLRNPEPSGGKGGFDPLLASEIERLAALSPHLLDDIGVAASDRADVVTASSSRARHNRMPTQT
jgi:hypothetical protein